MHSKSYKFRKPELEQYRSVWLTQEVYELLRKEKKKQKMSMAKILCSLVIDHYKEKKNIRT